MMPRRWRHGYSGSPTYYAWTWIKRRHHGEMDARWADFLVFLAEMGERPMGASLQRLDTALGYSRENCAWMPCGRDALKRVRQAYRRVYPRLPHRVGHNRSTGAAKLPRKKPDRALQAVINVV